MPGTLTLGLPRYHRWSATILCGMVVAFLLAPLTGRAQPQPTIGQEGKDVPWVPTPDALVDTMLAMAAVTPNDLLVDLGSGDGRTVIAAARLGARAIGIELDENLVDLSRRRAIEASVADRAEFRTTDLFEFDLSPATVVTMFLLPDINFRLRPKLLGLKPGTRIVSNTWDLSGSDDDPDAPGWTPDHVEVLEPCPSFCTGLLWIVPAKVDGTWQLADGELQLEQRFQMVSGRLTRSGRSLEIEDGRLRGTVLTFRTGETRYRGRVDPADATTIRGVAQTQSTSVDWSAKRRQ